MKKGILVLLTLGLVSCINQTVKTESAFLDDCTFEEVWMASIKAVNDIHFTVDGLDKSSGFIGAKSGRHIGQDSSPRLSILISESRGRVYVQCRVLQKEQFVDVLGHGRTTVSRFMTALNTNLNRAY